MNSSTLAAGVRQLRGMMASPGRHAENDEQLLYAFTNQHDNNAFAVLVRRYGPLVLGVCRRVLHNEQDAEDAFQATFLLLARNSAILRNKSALGSWLHGTAYRLALSAKRSVARRRKHEGQTTTRTPIDPTEELSWREARAILDEEIARLPELYRSVFVLCCLESASRAEAARRLGLKEGTVSSRLTAARKRLSVRLARRGIELSAVLAVASAAILPAGLLAKTVKAVWASVSGDGLASVAPASVVELIHSSTATMIWSKAKLLTMLLLTTTALAGAVAWTCGILGTPQTSQPQAEPARPPHAAKKQEPAARPSEDKIVTVGGCVLDGDGKPVPQARLYLPLLKGEQLRQLDTSDVAGRFRFQVKPEQVGLRSWVREPWRYVYVMALAEGHAPGIASVGDPAESEKLTIRLGRDNVAIKGRVLDLQGKPLAGVTIRVDGFGVPNKGDLTEFIKDLTARIDGYPAENRTLTTVYHADFARLWPTVKTDAEGRFRIKGIGGERLAHLTISGPTIVTLQVRVRTRPGETLNKLAWANNPEGDRLIYYGSEFEHAAAPTKPIIGVVRDRQTGKPLANVTIRSHKLAGSNLHGNGSLQTTTDKDGRYRLVGMPKGDGNIIVAHPPNSSFYLALERPVEDSPTLDPVTVNFDLKRGVLVKGRVTDKQTGKGMDAQIDYFVFQDNPMRNEFRDWHNNRYLVTEADGSFQMTVPPGHALLAARVYSDRYLGGVGAEKIKRQNQGDFEFLLTEPLCQPMAYHRLFEIDPAKDVQTLTCPLEVDPGRTLTGTIVGPDGTPLAGARISGLRSYLYTTWEIEPLRTADFAAYALAPDRQRSLLVIHEGKRLAGSLLLRGDEKGPVTIKLQPWGTLTGRLVTAAGKPYTKGELRFGLGATRNDPAVGSHPLHSIPRDNTGRFRVEGLVPGLKYHLVLLPGGRVGNGEEVTMAAGETKDLGDVTVKPNE